MSTQSLTPPMAIPHHRSANDYEAGSVSSHNSLSASPTSTSSSQSTTSYRELVKQMTAQAPKPYGAIPPLIGRNKRKKKQKDETTVSNNHTPEDIRAVATRMANQNEQNAAHKPPLMRSMSHVENWVAVDSKESLPDEEELEQRPSALRNFLSADFLTEVLPLHVPPPPLSDPESIKQQEEIAKLADTLKQTRVQSSASHQTEVSIDRAYPDSKRKPPLVLRKVRSMNDEDARWQETRTTSMAKLLQPKKLDARETKNQKRNNVTHHNIGRRHSLTSFPKVSPSPGLKPPVYPSMPTPSVVVEDDSWFTRLKRSFSGKKKDTNRKLIPMPPPPKRPNSQRRRSEATTQPRFNPATNTYMRDTRSNSDHLRMITAELNMMRARKLLSPLKPRGFLPRRRDVFLLGDIAKRPSPLCNGQTLENMEEEEEEEQDVV
ncbi:hypothetical protein INT43_002137 [Umbelopsis isabellina]|uniref:Uncharacterized protein n=1 Tax=Mortierella isabellina TaxID=91625 RepID=A0A8H7Q4C2_MORIS|nr:hypothetical protein INT43_002137 [Umbelopsis isabellina]